MDKYGEIRPDLTPVAQEQEKVAAERDLESHLTKRAAEAAKSAIADAAAANETRALDPTSSRHA